MNHCFDDFILIHPSVAKLSADTYHREMEERRIQMFHHKSFASPTPTLTSDSIPSSPPSVSRHREKIGRSLFTDKYGCIEPRFLIPLLDFESQEKYNAEHKNDSMIGFKLRPRTGAAAGSFPVPSQSQSNLVSASPRHSLDFNSTALPSPLLLHQVSPRSALDASFAEMKAHPISRRHSLNDTRKMSRRNSGSHALAA
eukprot:CAMPEP_0176501604 /NCGR_PEP_ID=MMETSP0200_2-20121128/14250_1 /TAXON_ID=947934 /ORGANISM="Chaetoceros sp., Strain GSL56" /LENGTH=197 /DNA_ID=CAMNT_0017900503 /DNA_START=52 /DNA_END=645 /DNA_ORIENTATION=-